MRSADQQTSGCVLIIDDTPSNVEVLSGILASEGYDMLTATDGESGLRLARECTPDLVLLDLVLPGIMGIEVLDVLKRERPDTIVILTTAFGSEETAIQAIRKGVNDYIINKRPFDADEVREVVRRARNEVMLRRENSRLQRELTSANQQLKEYSGYLEHSVDELRAANERLKNLDGAKASFFSMISHELRHPLTVAKGYLELVTANGSSFDNENQKYLAIAEQSLTILDKMLDDLLDLSRIEAGHYQIDRQTEGAAPLVNQTILGMTAAASAKEIKLETQVSASLPLVSADPRRIGQVLTNLVDNAIKFTPAGGLIKLSARELPNEVEFTVSDTGIGIAPSELEKIFDRFYQIKNPALPNLEGAGLGLAISREIVRLHGGQIWATSEEGRGTQLHFTLPKSSDTDST
jgi:two-component system, sensor histidine kinase and response regulator